MIDDWSKLLPRPEIRFPEDILRGRIDGQRVLITGAGGSIGRSLATALSAWNPDQLVCLDSHEASLVHLRQQLGRRPGSLDVRYVLADVRDREKLDQIFRRFAVDVVFHLAAYKQVPLAEDNIDQVIGVNLIGTLNIIETAVEHRIAGLIYPSTDKAVHPPSIYGMTKRVAERLLLAVGQEVERPAIRVIRLVNVFGTQGSVVELFARQIAGGQPLTITDPRMDRYWMTMHEAVQLLLGAAVQPTCPGVYLLEVGNPVLMTDTARLVHTLLRPGHGDPMLKVIGVRPGERLHEELAYPSERFEPTILPGLRRLASPASTSDGDFWLREVGSLREAYYRQEPVHLRSWLLEHAVEEPVSIDSHIAGPGNSR
ncbi:MAG TPA: SDR family NAD(P)-dependent oxidoreductase [Chloroflexota bacterium]|nr:SDR family NAD(P)-dependent oxidoreductase [Chloroflexota bacterium]